MQGQPAPIPRGDRPFRVVLADPPWATNKDGTPAFGTGYIYRSATEPWLLGTRGKPQALDTSAARSIRNCIVAPRREHSRKPPALHEMIEAQWPGPYLELFARETRPGWTTWGNQVGTLDDPYQKLGVA